MPDAQDDAQNPFAPPDSGPGAPVPPTGAPSPVGPPPSFPPPTGDPVGGPGWAATSPAASGYSPYAAPSTPPKARRRGVAWAIGGGIAAGVLLLSAVGYSVYTIVDDAITASAKSGTGPHASGDTVWVSDLRQGDCYILASSDRRDLTAGEVTIVDCQFAHDGEVYGTGTLDFATYPGARAVSDAAEKLCADHEKVLDPAVYDEDGLTGTWYSPLEEDWAAGPHSVECVVEADVALGLRRSWMRAGATPTAEPV